MSLHMFLFHVDLLQKFRVGVMLKTNDMIYFSFLFIYTLCVHVCLLRCWHR